MSGRAQTSAGLGEGFGGFSDAMEATVLSSPLLGGGLPAVARMHLDKAAERYHLTDVAETHLLQAAALAPGHVAVLIAFYRFYFYKGRLVDALLTVQRCLDKALDENLLGDDWRQVRAGDAAFSDWGALVPRFFLFCLKGYAYLSLRLGHLAEGRAAAEKLLEIEPLDRIGARLLIDVLDRLDDES
jgi:tetratricopeptide (TPR) repeat protein